MEENFMRKLIQFLISICIAIAILIVLQSSTLAIAAPNAFDAAYAANAKGGNSFWSLLGSLLLLIFLFISASLAILFAYKYIKLNDKKQKIINELTRQIERYKQFKSQSQKKIKELQETVDRLQSEKAQIQKKLDELEI